MTKTQHATLQWLADIGGTCIAWRDKVAHPSKVDSLLKAKAKGATKFEGSPLEYQLMPCVSALQLVQRGAIQARDGRLHITEYGRRLLKP
jgi:hypothetical protein